MAENKDLLTITPASSNAPAPSAASLDAKPVSVPAQESITISAAPAPASATKPSSAVPASPAPVAAAPTPPASTGGTFQNIFSQQKTETKGPKMIESILKKSSGPPKIKPILGKAPVLQKSLEQERSLQQKKKLRLVQIIFLVIFVSALAMAGYFYAELTPGFDLFGPNTTARLSDVNRNIRSLQTQVSKYRYLTAQLDLNAFSLEADNFLDRTLQMSGGAVVSATGLAQAASDLPAYLSDIRENLTHNIVVPLHRSADEPEITDEELLIQAQNDLKKAISDDRAKLAASPELSDVNRQEIRLMDNTIKLVGNTKLMNTLRGASTDNFGKQLNDYASTLDPALRQQIQSFLSSVLSSTKSEVATIGALKQGRINWSDIISDIEAVTITVDKNFGKGLTEALGEGIIYNGYEFETSSNKIVLSGVTLTNDAYNFTTITQLIDALEKDPRFMNVEMRSFSKSGTPEEGYRANFKIDLQIELPDGATAGKAVTLVKRTVAVTPSGKKRDTK